MAGGCACLSSYSLSQVLTRSKEGKKINKAARQPVSVGFTSDYTPHKLGEAGTSTGTTCSGLNANVNIKIPID